LIRQIMEAGAAGFIPKSSEPKLMMGALQLVLSKGIYLPPQVLGSINPLFTTAIAPKAKGAVPESLQAQLTARQLQMLELALKGVPNKLIARQFDISDGTVKSHLSTVYRVMNVRNRTEALYAVAK
jgi:DNA-binding NarL/FixJ family response regulator